jgi:carboxyl-terminal processing protease
VKRFLASIIVPTIAGIILLAGSRLVSVDQFEPAKQSQIPPVQTTSDLPSVRFESNHIPEESNTAPVETDPAMMRTFEELWTTVDKEYLYADYNGLDWDQVHEDVLEKLQAGVDEEDFYILMDQMIRMLDDEHSYFLSPQQVQRQNQLYAGSNTYIGIGVFLKPLPDERKALVLLTYDDSPAEEAGLQTYDHILEVNGKPIIGENGAIKSLFQDADNEMLELLVQSSDQTIKKVIVSKSEIPSQIPIPNDVFLSPSGKRIGYIMLVSFTDKSIPDRIGEILEYMSQHSDLDGLIIDNRLNQGGALSTLQGALSYFISGRVGFFANRVRDLPFFIDEPHSVGNSQVIPLVVLIGPDTTSYGEIFAGILQDSNRAVLVGEPTNGNVETLWGFDFRDGSRAWIAHDTFIPSSNPEPDWEENGVQPDLQVLTNWNEISRESDPAILSAVEYLDKPHY